MALRYGRIASIFAATMLALGMLDSLNLVPFGQDREACGFFHATSPVRNTEVRA